MNTKISTVCSIDKYNFAMVVLGYGISFVHMPLTAFTDVRGGLTPENLSNLHIFLS